MKNTILITVMAITVVIVVARSQTVPAATEPAPVQQSVSGADTSNANDGLSDLDAMTFSCPKAALNAAAREAGKVPSQGTYQFAYFNIISDSHHSLYEIHFKSNYQGETDLKYCVSIYCQQGWDPKTSKTSIKLMSNERQPVGEATHEADCGSKHTPVKYRLKR
jgi:hypothetical protein